MSKILPPSCYAFILLAFALFATSCNTSRRSIGIEAGWELLAERKVNFVRDKDEIPVRSPYQFIAIRFQVEDKPVIISNLKIVYTNGDKLEPNIDENIAAGKSSRVIELGRDGRSIDRIEFKYRSTGSLLSGRANVLVLGQRYTNVY